MVLITVEEYDYYHPQKSNISLVLYPDMKNFSLLLAVFLLVKPLWPIIEYSIQYDYIVTVLCENKDQPELECNGSCYLSKQLAKEANNDQENPLNSSNKTEVPQILIFEELKDFDFIFPAEIATLNLFEEMPENYHYLFSFEILDPPQVV